VYGTFAGAAVAPLGLAAFWFGPQWPLRVASIIFLTGMVIALRLPPRADSDPPEAVPAPFRAMLRLRRPAADKPISGKLVVSTLIGSASLRTMYGFLLLFLAFAIKAGDLDTTVLGWQAGGQGAVAVVAGALGAGTFLATAIGTRLRIHRPTAVQASGIVAVAAAAALATVFYSLLTVALLCLVTAVVSGIAKLAIDASIQERVPERLRASAFAHSETVLMLAWVAGGGAGIIPLDGRIGVGLVTAFAVAAAVRAVIVAAKLRRERLHGRPGVEPDPEPGPTAPTAAPPVPDDTEPEITKPDITTPDITKPDITKPDLTDTPTTVPVRPGGRPGRSTGRSSTPTSPAVPRSSAPAPGHDPAPPGFHIYRPTSATDQPGRKTP
jgi:hypothetical protein